MEKASQNEKVLAKIPRVTAFLQATAISISAVTVDDGQNAGSSEPGVAVVQCCPTFLTPRATEELILEAEGRTIKLKSND